MLFFWVVVAILLFLHAIASTLRVLASSLFLIYFFLWLAPLAVSLRFSVWPHPGKDKAEVVAKLYQRLRPDLNKKESVGFAIDLIRQAMNSTLTRQYDNFQWLSNGILP